MQCVSKQLTYEGITKLPTENDTFLYQLTMIIQAIIQVDMMIQVVVFSFVGWLKTRHLLHG